MDHHMPNPYLLKYSGIIIQVKVHYSQCNEVVFAFRNSVLYSKSRAVAKYQVLGRKYE
jgi:hypothetical protein